MSENIKFTSNDIPLTGRMSIRTRKIAIISKLGGQINVKDIAKKLGISEHTAEVEIRAMVQDGYLREIGDNSEWAVSNDYSNMKAGDKIEFMGRKGTLLTDAHYEINKLAGYQGSGLHYSDIVWDDRTFNNNFMLNRNGLKWKPSGEVRKKEEVKSKIVEKPKRGELDKWFSIV
jgi:hypothetical protein